jgi:hypothetical protein
MTTATATATATARALYTAVLTMGRLSSRRRTAQNLIPHKHPTVFFNLPRQHIRHHPTIIPTNPPQHII